MAYQRGRAHDQPMRRRPSRTSGPERHTSPAVDMSRLREIVTSLVRESRYDLENCAVQRVGHRYLVRIVIDSDAGVDLDQASELSRRISINLDRSEADVGVIIPGEYDLEVGSPGVDRPLTEARHWRRNRGRLVRVRAAGRQLTGRIMQVDENGIVLDLEGVSERLDFSDLGPGRVHIEFSRSVEDEDLVVEGESPEGDLVDDGEIDNEREDEE